MPFTAQGMQNAQVLAHTLGKENHFRILDVYVMKTEHTTLDIVCE